MDKSSISGYDVFCGIDVGKTSHYVVALDSGSDKRLINRPVDQEEKAIRKVLKEASRFGSVLVSVDQSNNVGRLVVAVSQSMGIDVAHIPPRSFKKVAETYGETKTDALDAFIIADASRTMPRLINLIGGRDEAVEEIRILSTRRADVVKEKTIYYNRIHDLLLQVCPPLESMFQGERLHTEIALLLLARYGGPVTLRKSGKGRCKAWAAKLKGHSRRGPHMIDRMFSAIDQMTITMPASSTAEEQIRRLAKRALELRDEERELDELIAEKSTEVPEVAILQSIPGVGKVFGAVIASEIGDIERFPDADHLASYAGVSPVKEMSGTSIHRTKKKKGGNRKLKYAFIQSALCAVRHDPISRRYYDKKRSEGRSHRQALRALARKRVTMIYALLDNGTFYEEPTKAA